MLYFLLFIGLISSTQCFVFQLKSANTKQVTNTQRLQKCRNQPLKAFAGAEILQTVAAVPVMYSLMSVNEYITHRYYQHGEVNKEPILQKILCTLTNQEKFEKIKGGGHVEHHAETYDDMTLRSDERWKKTQTAITLDSDEYRGTAFSWKVLGLMTLQMIPTTIPIFHLMGFSLLSTFLVLIPSMLLHGLIW